MAPTWHHRLRCFVTLLIAWLAACHANPGGTDVARASDATDIAPDSIESDSPVDAPRTDAVQPDASISLHCPDPSQLGQAPLRRLSNREYSASIRAVLGDDTDVITRFQFPLEPRVNGFEDTSVASAITAPSLSLYADAAAFLIDRLSTDRARRATVIGCNPGGWARSTCMSAFVRREGRRLLRRPLRESEVARWEALAHSLDTDPDPYAGPLRALEAMLVSPSFLFRLEPGHAIPGCAGVRRLDGFEIATRLSFLLLGEPPDDHLLDLAASGALDSPDRLEQFASTMLADPRAREAVWRFFSGWLRTDELAFRSGDPEGPWTNELRDAMVMEVRRVVDSFVWTDGTDLLDIIDTRRTYVNDVLARHYGLATIPPPGEWTAIDWDASSERAGVLTQGSLLMATAPASGTQFAGSAIRRGLFVRQALLCETIPPPPPDAIVNPGVPMGSERDRLAAHSASPRCATCHTRLDPVGFGLERFTEMGLIRNRGDDGSILTGDGNLEGFDPPAFHGSVELATRLRAAPALAPCVARQWYRWTMGRAESAADEDAITSLTGAFEASHHSFRALILASVRSAAFRLRAIPPSVESGP